MLLSSDTLYCDAPATCFVMDLPDYDTKEFLRFETVKYIYDLCQCIKPNISMSMYLTYIRWNFGCYWPDVGWIEGFRDVSRMMTLKWHIQNEDVSRMMTLELTYPG